MHSIVALHFGPVLSIAESGTDEWWDKPWETGFYKELQAEGGWLGYQGFRGDEQADRRFHGGADKAVCVYPMEHYAHWKNHLAQPGMVPGAFGENLTLAGLHESAVCVGDIFRVGEALVQVSQPRQPCWKLARRWQVKDLAVQVERSGFTGYYFRVLRHGWVRPGDSIIREDRSFPEWTISVCNEVMHHRKSDRAAALALSECPALSASWKDSLYARSQAASEAPPQARIGQP